MKERKKILVIDDNRDILRTMKDILKTEGYIVETEKSPFQSMKKVQSKEYDLVLIDIHIPELAGYDALIQLKKVCQNNPKFIYVSVVPEGEVFMEGADDFIQKPFSIGDVLTKVRNVLQ